MSKQTDIDDTRQQVATRAAYRCEVCGKPTPWGRGQLAHRIPQRKRNLKKYGKRIIHHPRNLAWTCSLECNAAVSLGAHTAEIERLAEDIRRYLWNNE
jgi:hypothetical protein